MPDELAGVGECAARVVRLLGSELQVEVVAAELQPVRAAIQRDVVEELELLVVARGEDRRIAERAVEAAGRDLREAGVARIAWSRQAGRPAARTSLPRFRLIWPPSTLIQPTRTSFSSDVPKTCVLARHEVPRPGRQRAAEPRHERFLQHAGAERLQLVGVERAEARQQLVGGREPVIEPQAELIEMAILLFDRGQVLQAGRGRRQRHVRSSADAIGSMRLAGI